MPSDITGANLEGFPSFLAGDWEQSTSQGMAPGSAPRWYTMLSKLSRYRNNSKNCLEKTLDCSFNRKMNPKMFPTPLLGWVHVRFVHSGWWTLSTVCALVFPPKTPAQGYCCRIFHTFLTVSSPAPRVGIYIALMQHLRKETQFIRSCHNAVPEHQALVLNFAFYASAKQSKNYS